MSPASEGDKMKSFAIAGLAVTALIAPAMAADMAPLPYKAPVPVTNWTGCYVGADAGAAWSAQDVANSAPSSLDQAGVVGTINGAGPVGGGYAGCNLQVTPVWVVGLEGDFSATHLGGSANVIHVLANGSPPTIDGIQKTSRLNWIASVRGRVGLSFIRRLSAGMSRVRRDDLQRDECRICCRIGLRLDAMAQQLDRPNGIPLPQSRRDDRDCGTDAAVDGCCRQSRLEGHRGAIGAPRTEL